MTIVPFRVTREILRSYMLVLELLVKHSLAAYWFLEALTFL